MPVIGRSIDEIEVGQTATFTRTFTEDEVKQFADLTWDHNPYHLHPEFTKKNRFGKPVVHGLLVAAAFCHFGGDLFPGPAILATSAEMEFMKPVHFGETITFIAEVTEVDRERGRITYVTTAENEAGEEVCRVICEGIPTAIEVDKEAK
jgi:3-hydroxybutyryl-CoA dehydratase